MTKFRRIAAVAIVGMCMGATFSAFTASSTSAKYYRCNHTISILEAQLASGQFDAPEYDRLAARLEHLKSKWGC